MSTEDSEDLKLISKWDEVISKISIGSFFWLFPKLPAEIREMIWIRAVGDDNEMFKSARLVCREVANSHRLVYSIMKSDFDKANPQGMTPLLERFKVQLGTKYKELATRYRYRDSNPWILNRIRDIIEGEDYFEPNDNTQEKFNWFIFEDFGTYLAGNISEDSDMWIKRFITDFIDGKYSQICFLKNKGPISREERARWLCWLVKSKFTDWAAKKVVVHIVTLGYKLHSSHQLGDDEKKAIRKATFFGNSNFDEMKMTSLFQHQNTPRIVQFLDQYKETGMEDLIEANRVIEEKREQLLERNRNEKRKRSQDGEEEKPPNSDKRTKL